MRILLDECVDRRLERGLTGHSVSTVPRMGWAGIKNGKLLLLAESEFDVLLTVDRNLSSQQNLAKFRIAILLVLARSNRLQDVMPLVPQILEKLTKTTPGILSVVGE